MATAARPELTDRQREIYDFIRAATRCPTVREIQAAFGIVSPNGVMCHIRGLVAKGYLTAAEGQSRAWLILDAAGRVIDDRESLRLALHMVLDRLQAVPSAEPDEGIIGFSGYFSRAEVEHLAALAGEPDASMAHRCVSPP